MTVQVRDGVVRLEPRDWQEMVEGGQMPGGVASLPGMAEVLTAARAPVLQLQLDVASERLRTRHHASVDLDAIALLAQVRGAEHQLMAFPPASLAGSLARLTRLGPRKTGPRQVREAEEDLLDDLFHDDAMRRLSAFQLLGARWAWLLATFGREAELRLAVVEDADGSWLVEPSQDGWRLAPTTATALWRRLTTVLVDTAEPLPVGDEGRA